MPSDGSREEVEEAILEGDTRFRPGTARSALARPAFRRIYVSFFFSNIGTWMQQVALGALAYELTDSPIFVGLMLFAQLGPTLFIGPVAGVIADSVDRRRLLFCVSAAQIASAVGLALIVRVDEPSEVAIFLSVLVGGIANAVFMPTFSAILPQLVGKADMPGAISLQSTQMNLSRVVGPLIGAVALGPLDYWGIFLLNGASYLFLVAALVPLRLTPTEAATEDERGFRRLTSGLRIARRDPVIGRSLVVIATFSSLCLLWVGQMPVIAAEELGMSVDRETGSAGYQVLFACLGLGAAVGSLAIGTVFTGSSKPMLVRRGLVAYAVLLTAFALLDSPAPAYPVVVALSACYFGSVTALNTTMQARLADHERGRVMALWMMGFGGAVSLANLVLSPIVELVGMPPLMIGGAAIALWLSRYAALEAPPRVVEAPSSALAD